MKLEPTVSIKPPRKKEKEVVKEKPKDETNLMRFVKEDKEIHKV